MYLLILAFKCFYASFHKCSNLEGHGRMWVSILHMLNYFIHPAPAPKHEGIKFQMFD